MADTDSHQNLETSASSPNSTTAPNSSIKASKDRQCPFCNQAFTSSSLGRHLDLYIKPKNPKPPDGVHDVDEIRRIRGAITRRQPRSSVKAVTNNTDISRQDIDASLEQSAEPGEIPNKEQYKLENGFESSAEKRSNTTKVHTMLNPPVWQATGVINNLPPRAPSRGNSEAASGQAHRANEMRRDYDGSKIQRPDYETENIWKLQDTAELGRAAEMALREVLGSLEAARKKMDPKVLFDDFDFFSLSFPGLCLAVLPPPTTLFTQTPFSNGESWTLGPPGQRQYETMVRFVNERFNQRRQTDPIPDSIAFRHHQHLSGAWEHWQTLPDNDCASVWTLEILRSFTRAREQKNELQAELQAAQQHSRHLEAEYDRLSRCQLPREYLLHPPNTLPISKEVMREVQLTRLKSGVAEVNYDAEALLAKWRSQIRATTRPSRVAPTPRPGSTPAYTPTATNHDPSMTDEIIMNGAVWGGINGPMPRQKGADVKHYATQDFDYENPHQPGVIVGADEDEDVDADGEAEEVGGGQQQSHHNALIRRHQASPNGGRGSGANSLGGVVNNNGKRPLTPNMSGGRGSFKIYKERHDIADGGSNERSPY